jgi:hypothetical protein
MNRDLEIATDKHPKKDRLTKYVKNVEESIQCSQQRVSGIHLDTQYRI